jgi:AcrR family transcriptional regulator
VTTRGAASPRSERQPIETLIQDKALVAQRHDEIFRAASRVFISRGYHRATVREIAREAGLSLGGLYSYVKSKEDILYLVFDKLSRTLRESMRCAIEGVEDPVEQMRAALRADLKATEELADEILLLYRESKSLDRSSLRAVLGREADYVKFFEEILRAGFQSGVFTGDPRLTADIIAYLCSILALRRWNLATRFSSDQIRDGLTTFILRGLGVAVAT